MFKSLTGLRAMVPEVSRITHLSRPVKLTALSLSLGIALIGALAMFFRRRRKRTQMIQKKLEAKNQRQQQSQNHHQHHTHPHIQRPQGLMFGSGNRSVTTSLRKLRSSHLTRTQAPNGGTGTSFIFLNLFMFYVFILLHFVMLNSLTTRF